MTVYPENVFYIKNEVFFCSKDININSQFQNTGNLCKQEVSSKTSIQLLLSESHMN